MPAQTFQWHLTPSCSTAIFFWTNKTDISTFLSISNGQFLMSAILIDASEKPKRRKRRNRNKGKSNNSANVHFPVINETLPLLELHEEQPPVSKPASRIVITIANSSTPKGPPVDNTASTVETIEIEDDNPLPVQAVTQTAYFPKATNQAPIGDLYNSIFFCNPWPLGEQHIKNTSQNTEAHQQTKSLDSHKQNVQTLNINMSTKPKHPAGVPIRRQPEIEYGPRHSETFLRGLFLRKC